MDEGLKKEIKSEISSLIISNASEMTIADLTKDYWRIVGKNLPRVLTGYTGVLDFLNRECADILTLQKRDWGYVICPFISQQSEHINKLIAKSRYTKLGKKRSEGIYTNAPSALVTKDIKPDKTLNTIKVSNGKEKINLKEKIRSNLKTLITENKEILSSKLLSMYKDRFGDNLPYARMGFGDVISMCSSFKDIFNIQRDSQYGAWKLYDKNIVVNKTSSKDTAKEADFAPEDFKSDAELTELDRIIYGLDALPGIGLDPSVFPHDCIKLHDKITKVTPPSKSTKVEVAICEIFDPSHFWIQLYDEVDKLESLMNKMDQFYYDTKNTVDYSMPRAVMRTGQYCAVTYMDGYHRAVVLYNVDLNTVKVRYVDFGTVSDVPSESIKFLTKKFAELPIQACRGRVANIGPLDSAWSLEAKKRFFNLANNKSFTANVVKIEENDILHLDLIRHESKTYTLVIADILYSEGFARFDSTLDWKDENNAFFLPTFEDLESGVDLEKPNSAEVCSLLNVNKDNDYFSASESGYFNDDMSCSTSVVSETLDFNKKELVIEESVSNNFSILNDPWTGIVERNSFDINYQINQSMFTPNVHNYPSVPPWNMNNNNGYYPNPDYNPYCYQQHDRSNTSQMYFQRFNQANYVMPPQNNMSPYFNSQYPQRFQVPHVPQPQYFNNVPNNYDPSQWRHNNNESYINDKRVHRVSVPRVSSQNVHNENLVIKEVRVELSKDSSQSEYEARRAGSVPLKETPESIKDDVKEGAGSVPLKETPESMKDDAKRAESVSLGKKHESSNLNNDNCGSLGTLAAAKSDDSIVSNWEMLATDNNKSVEADRDESKSDDRNDDEDLTNVKDYQGDGTKLLLVGIELLLGRKIGIWKIESPDRKEKEHLVILEQICDILGGEECWKCIKDDIYSEKAKDLDVICARYYKNADVNVSDIIKKSVIFNMNIGEYILFDLLIENSDNVDGHLALVPLDLLFNLLYTFKKVFKSKFRNVLIDLTKIIPYY